MIALKNIKKYYKMGNVTVKALKDVNLDINERDMICLSGPSGSGKSTLLNLVGAMDTPTDGSIYIDNEDITYYTSSKLTKLRAEKIGFIFQNFNLIPSLDVFENIVVPMKLKAQKYNKDDVITLIERVGLSHHIKHRPDELSGGQQQRVAIARALVHKPKYIMADEPTANLDSKTSKTIIELLNELNEYYGVTIIFASHDPWLKDIIKREVKLIDGSIVQ